MVESGWRVKTLGKMGNTKSLRSISGLPQLSGALNGWETALLLVRLTQQVVDGFPQDIAHQIPFHGMVQPLTAKQIALKPEGERAWTWLQIHVKASSPVMLDTHDRIMDGCRKYKIMGKLPYGNNGFVEYHAIEDFQNG